MKFKKPFSTACTMPKAVCEFIDSLPDEFEILGPGEVAVVWPKEVTKEALLANADYIGRKMASVTTERIMLELNAIAAIAPERKAPTKRRVAVLQFQGHGETFGKLELSFNMVPQFPWVKVGECEIEE